MNKAAGLILLSLLLLAMFSPAVLAADGSLFDKVLGVFSMNFLKNVGPNLTHEQAYGAFVRLALWLVIFSVFNLVGQRIGLAGKAGSIVALAIATISLVFLPDSLLLALGEAYATILAWILFGSLIIGMLYLHFKVLPGDSAFWIAIRILSLFLILTILNKIHVDMIPTFRDGLFFLSAPGFFRQLRFRAAHKKILLKLLPAAFILIALLPGALAASALDADFGGTKIIDIVTLLIWGVIIWDGMKLLGHVSGGAGGGLGALKGMGGLAGIGKNVSKGWTGMLKGEQGIEHAEERERQLEQLDQHIGQVKQQYEQTLMNQTLQAQARLQQLSQLINALAGISTALANLQKPGQQRLMSSQAKQVWENYKRVQKLLLQDLQQLIDAAKKKRAEASKLAGTLRTQRKTEINERETVLRNIESLLTELTRVRDQANAANRSSDHLTQLLQQVEQALKRDTAQEKGILVLDTELEKQLIPQEETLLQELEKLITGEEKELQAMRQVISAGTKKTNMTRPWVAQDLAPKLPHLHTIITREAEIDTKLEDINKQKEQITQQTQQITQRVRELSAAIDRKLQQYRQQATRP